MIKGKPDVTRFLDGGAAAEASQAVAKKIAMKVVATTPKRKKLVELPELVFDALKDRAYQEYKKSGRRVTETELIIAALSQYLGLKS